MKQYKRIYTDLVQASDSWNFESLLRKRLADIEHSDEDEEPFEVKDIKYQVFVKDDEIRYTALIIAEYYEPKIDNE